MRQRLTLVSLIGFLAVAASCAPGSSTEAHDRPSWAHGTPAITAEDGGPGSPLADNLVVPPGAERVGPVLPGPVRQEPGGRGWSALLLVRGDAEEVVVDIQRQAASVGLSAYGQLHVDPATEAAGPQQVRVWPTGLPPGHAPACARVGSPATIGVRCIAGASGSARLGISVEAMQGQCAVVSCPSSAPSLALIQFCCSDRSAGTVPFPPAGWVPPDLSPVVTRGVRLALPTAISRPGDRLRIPLPNGVTALAPPLCIGLETCYQSFLLSRVDRRDGPAALAALVDRTATGPSWERYDGARYREGGWVVHRVFVGDFDDSVAYTLYETDGSGPSYITAVINANR